MLSSVSSHPADPDIRPGPGVENSGCRVLLVDGSPTGRQLMARVVRHSFSAVDPMREAGDLEQAREILGLGSGHPGTPPLELGLLLCEVDLPDGPCTELFADLQGHPCRKVVLTLQRNDEQVLLALGFGADGYLLKQEPCARLAQELQRLATGQPALSAWAASTVLHHFRHRHASARDARPAEPREIAVGAIALSHREMEVLRHLSTGMTIREMAQTLQIRWFTVNDHLKAIYRKLGVNSRAEAAVIAARAGLI